MKLLLQFLFCLLLIASIFGLLVYFKPSNPLLNPVFQGFLVCLLFLGLPALVLIKSIIKLFR